MASTESGRVPFRLTYDRGYGWHAASKPPPSSNAPIKLTGSYPFRWMAWLAGWTLAHRDFRGDFS